MPRVYSNVKIICFLGTDPHPAKSFQLRAESSPYQWRKLSSTDSSARRVSKDTAPHSLRKTGHTKVAILFTMEVLINKNRQRTSNAKSYPPRQQIVICRMPTITLHLSHQKRAVSWPNQNMHVLTLCTKGPMHIIIFLNPVIHSNFRPT